MRDPVGRAEPVAVADADIVAHMREDHSGVHAVLAALRAREVRAASRFQSEFKEYRRRRQPACLQPLILELPTEKRLVYQRRVDEVPGVGMYFVEITEPGEEAAELYGDAGNEAGVLHIAFLHPDLVLRGDRH